MIFKLNNNKFSVSWQYDNEKVKAFRSGQKEKYLCVKTTCKIKNLSSSEEIISSCTCSTKDLFSKQKGRQLSFFKAVNKFTEDYIVESNVNPTKFSEAERSIKTEIFDQLRKDEDFNKILGLR